MKVIISHLTGNSSEDMQFVSETSKSKFIIKPSEISPVEYFLSGLIACSATDMIVLPKNGNYSISELQIIGEVERNEVPPRKFNNIHLIYKFNSNASDLIARRWVLSTLETYCSTINTVRGVSKIQFSIIHNDIEIAKENEIDSGIKNLELDKNNGEIPKNIGGACET